MRKICITLFMTLAILFCMFPNNSEASIHIAGSIYMDETSAVKIQDENLVRKFAVNLYDDNTKETHTIWFYFSPADDPYNDLLNVKARYSWDNFKTWDWFITDYSSPLGITFRAAWDYALGYSFT